MLSLWRRRATPNPTRPRPPLDEPISHHPSEDELLDYTVGAGELWSDVFIACHLTLCPTCRHQITFLEALGGALLSNERNVLEASVTRPTRTKDPTHRLGPRVPSYQRKRRPVEIHEELARDLPRPLHPFLRDPVPQFRRHLLGLEQLPLTLLAANRPVRLLRLNPGFTIEPHGHAALEWTLILSGKLRDPHRNQVLVRGDISRSTENDTHHQTVDPSEPCIALIANLGPTLPRTLSARLRSKITGL